MATRDLWFYLALARKEYAQPTEAGGWFRIDDWMASEDYAKAVLHTPPWPCKSCYKLNTRTEGAPVRPFGQPPPPSKCDNSKRAVTDPNILAWIKYWKDTKAILTIVEKAANTYEVAMADTRGISQHRRLRKRNYTEHIECMADQALLAKAAFKVLKGKALTLREKAVYDPAQQRMGQNALYELARRYEDDKQHRSRPRT